MSFRPYPTLSSYIFLGVALVAGAATLYLLDRLIQSELTTAFSLLLWFLLTLIVLGLAVYWSIVAFSLKYHINRNGLAIQRGLSQYLIPIETIDRVIPGHDLPQSSIFVGLNVAGLHIGRGRNSRAWPLELSLHRPTD